MLRISSRILVNYAVASLPNPVRQGAKLGVATTDERRQITNLFGCTEAEMPRHRSLVDCHHVNGNSPSAFLRHGNIQKNRNQTFPKIVAATATARLADLGTGIIRHREICLSMLNMLCPPPFDLDRLDGRHCACGAQLHSHVQILVPGAVLADRNDTPYYGLD